MAEQEITSLFTLALQTGLQKRDIKETAKLKNVTTKNNVQPRNYIWMTFIVVLIAMLYGLSLPKAAYKKPLRYMKGVADSIYQRQANCVVNSNENFIEVTRPPVNCKICRNTQEVPIYYNMTKEYFIKHHAYTGIPALIKGGAQDWSALNVFGYKYFKDLYTSEKALDDFDDKECQFFTYKTNLHTLRHVFKMSKKRATLKKDQWYIGWSNCIDRVQNKLRQHYTRPSFLPDDAESSSLDWIFMGGSGTGAIMHIDGVNRPSWQAMIKGSKTWWIEPPPECLMECSAKRMNATMQPGDILVIDTNKWFHSTYIYPGEMSITIGSEYD